MATLFRRISITTASFAVTLIIMSSISGCSSSTSSTPAAYNGLPGVGSTFTMRRTDSNGPIDLTYSVFKASGSRPDTVWSVAAVPGLSVTDTIAYIIQASGDVLLRRAGVTGARVWLKLPFGGGATSNRYDTLRSPTLYFVTTGSSTGSGSEVVGSETLAAQCATLLQTTTDAAGLSTTVEEHLEYSPTLNIFIADSTLASSMTPGSEYRLISHSLKN